MPDPVQIAMAMAQRDPRISSNPNAQHLLKVIQSGDRDRGIQIADNLCTTYGVSREDAIAQAKRFFGI